LKSFKAGSTGQGGTFDTGKIRGEIEELEKKSTAPNFWDDQEKAGETLKKVASLKKRIAVWDNLESKANDLVALIDLVKEENDLSFYDEILETYTTLKKDYKIEETISLLSGEEDRLPAIVAIHPGAGGIEAQDWAGMLLRMYLQWAARRGFGVKIVDETKGDEAGVKGVTFLVDGDYATGLLKGERGVHRLVRISPFDAANRRHTSFASVDVVPEIDENIEIDLDENDLKIDTYRASGAGGQHVNKTDSAVRITHLPTGIVVQCQNERSQFANKAMALKILKSRLYEAELRKREEALEAKRGEKSEIAWGSQIRNYVFHPYHLIKDNRTGLETSNTQRFMDGEIDDFIYAYLRSRLGKGQADE
jgi:peptide chain release factor 2